MLSNNYNKIEYGANPNNTEILCLHVFLNILRCKHDAAIKPNWKTLPKTLHTAKKMRSFHSEWYSFWQWFSYSISRDVIYCFACRHFALSKLLYCIHVIKQIEHLEEGHLWVGSKYLPSHWLGWLGSQKLFSSKSSNTSKIFYPIKSRK